ncbi:MAG: putative rane protein, partial [Myxococcaceae bacterium]|nr:putative rane protein [Myxococcaceae bacterium]
MTQRSYVGVLEVLALSVLALSGAYQMACVFRPMGFLNAYLMYRDDGYYYLELARNLAQSGVATFDGVHRTSGVQLLWTAVLVPLASALPSRSAFLHGVLVLSALLSTLAGLLLYRLGRVLDSRAFGSFAVLLWSGLMLTLRPMMQGLEYPLHVVIVLLLIGALFGLRDAGA